jgi:hypothetical protein
MSGSWVLRDILHRNTNSIVLGALRKLTGSRLLQNTTLATHLGW